MYFHRRMQLNNTMSIPFKLNVSISPIPHPKLNSALLLVPFSLMHLTSLRLAQYLQSTRIPPHFPPSLLAPPAPHAENNEREEYNGQKLRARIPTRRFGQLRDLDGPLLLLASDAGSHITGATLAQRTIREGGGRSRAYGCGMIRVAPGSAARCQGRVLSVAIGAASREAAFFVRAWREGC